MSAPVADSAIASAAVWAWTASNIGPISTIILMVIAMTKYLEKRNNERTENAKKDVMVHVDMKLESIMKDMESMKANEELIRNYFERDLAELKTDVKRLINSSVGMGSASIGIDSNDDNDNGSRHHYASSDSGKGVKR